MKYTFVNENGKEQTVNIPEDFIQRNKNALRISTKEAILLYLSDEGYITDPTVVELTEKAKEGKVRAKSDKPRKAPKRKEDPIKRAIISHLYQFLLGGEIEKDLMFGKTLSPIEIINPERIIAFSIGEDQYELTLSKKRKK